MFDLDYGAWIIVSVSACLNVADTDQMNDQMLPESQKTHICRIFHIAEFHGD